MSYDYEPVRNLPVAQFYYRGQSHSHPVRRTVVVIDSDRNHITGYEVREGNITRDIDDAPVKSYCRDKIATRGQCRLGSTPRSVSKRRLNESTLVRSNWQVLEEQGA
jgi:hypothetical protein